MGSNPAIPTNRSDGRVIAVFGGDDAFGATVAAGLALSGRNVAAVGEAGLSSGDAYAAALRAAAPTGISAVVDAGLLGQEPAAGELASLDPETWRRDAEQPLRRALHLMQGAHSCLAGEGGRIIVLLPSLVMSGAAGAVAWAAAAEGYRSLAKAAARAWGSSGISIKCVLVPAAVAVTSVADRPGLQPPAIGRLPDPGSDIAPAIVALLDSRLDTVTGVTVAVDGGVWMTS